MQATKRAISGGGGEIVAIVRRRRRVELCYEW